MTDILSKAEREEMRQSCAPLSPGIVQPTADAMVIALCAHADAMDEKVAALSAAGNAMIADCDDLQWVADWVRRWDKAKEA